MRPEEKDIRRLFKEALPSARQEEESGKRVYYRLLLAQSEGTVIPLQNDDEERRGLKLRWRPIAIAATTVLASSAFILLLASGLWRSGKGGLTQSGESVTAGNNGKSQTAPVQQFAPPARPEVAPGPAPSPAEAVAPPPQSQTPAAAANTPEPDSLLVIGTASAGVQSSQRSESGNGSPGPAADDRNRLFATTTPEAERAMEQAMGSQASATDVLFLAQANYFQVNRAEYFVPVNLKVSGSQLSGSVNAGRVVLDIVGQATDAYGTTVQRNRDLIDVRLPDETAKQLPARQIAFDTSFMLLPGKYSIKFLVHDRVTGRVGTYRMDVDIPNLSKPDKNLPISSVVLSTQLVNLHEALSNSTQPPGFSLESQLSADPLFIEGKKLIPSMKHTFSKRSELIVFFQAYEANAAATEPLTASVALYRGQTKVFETSPVTIKDDLGQRWRTLPVKLPVPLSSVPAGVYDCQVTVTDAVSQKSTVWRSQIEVVN